MIINTPSEIQRSPWILTGPVIAILFSHYIVDVYSSVIPPLIGVVQTEFNMNPARAAFLLGIGSLCSGLGQPVFAWISDTTRSRIFGPAGILLASLGIGLLGYSGSTTNVFVLYSIGMLGIGMFHPIATAKIGAIAGNQRSFALSLFFVFGMAGFFTGSLVGPHLTTVIGTLKSLSYLILPGLFMAIVLQLNINTRTRKKTTQAFTQRPKIDGYAWRSILLLYISAILRFLVNMAIIYLIVRWVEQFVAQSDTTLSVKQISQNAAPIAGKAHAFMFFGQGLGGLFAGTVIVAGKEKRPLILTPILFAPFLIALAFLKPNAMGFLACFLGGVGFAAMTPITISVGQRLMPGHTRLASGLMLGGAWAIAAGGPAIAQALIDRFSLEAAIITIGCTLCFAGLANIGLSNRAIIKSVVND